MQLKFLTDCMVLMSNNAVKVKTFVNNHQLRHKSHVHCGEKLNILHGHHHINPVTTRGLVCSF